MVDVPALFPQWIVRTSENPKNWPKSWVVEPHTINTLRSFSLSNGIRKETTNQYQPIVIVLIGFHMPQNIPEWCEMLQFLQGWRESVLAASTHMTQIHKNTWLDIQIHPVVVSATFACQATHCLCFSSEIRDLLSRFPPPEPPALLKPQHQVVPSVPAPCTRRVPPAPLRKTFSWGHGLHGTWLLWSLGSLSPLQRHLKDLQRKTLWRTFERAAANRAKGAEALGKCCGKRPQPSSHPGRTECLLWCNYLLPQWWKQTTKWK